MLRQDAVQQAVEVPQAVVAAPARGLRAIASDYLALTKPRIVGLLLITTIPAMIMAHEGWPSGWLILLTLAGGTLSAAGANAINCYIDRDIDGMMARTRNRPLPDGRIEPQLALIFGIALGVAGFAVLAATVNFASALLATGALVFYVFVYTIWLKRTTTQNIVIGGAAGAMPPLIGWAAVTGGLDWPAAVLFGIVFFWTPPHFWAIALRYQTDYERASVPMLPVVSGAAETGRQMLLYSVALVATSLLLWPVAGTGWLYPVVALALGAGFISFAYRVWREPGDRTSKALFLYSLPYLALLFVAAGVDQFVWS